ncbi:MAG: hypothetical protein JW757_03920 [Anaerolineales bacterium]|nr:hypothetical protein [Anaerolineales bacterium]
MHTVERKNGFESRWWFPLKPRHFLAILSLLLILGACNYPGVIDSPNGLTRAWIDAPLDGSHLPLAAYQIVYHGADPIGISKVELRINDDLVDSHETFELNQQIKTFSYLWQPVAPGNYTLRVRTQNFSNSWSDDAVAEVIIDQEEQVVEASPVPEIANTPAPTACLPTATFTVDANCRSGPNIAYQSLTIINAGQSATIIGKNQQSTWWNIQLPNAEADCWVSGITVETSCISEEIPMISTPPLITSPVVSTNDFHWGDCDLRKVTIQADIVGDTPISYVTIYFRIKQQSWSQMEMEKIGENTYSITLNSHTDIPGAPEQIPSPLWYYLVAMDTSGLFTTSETYQNVNLSKCP